MPGHGNTIPKPDDQRRRRNKVTTLVIHEPTVGERRGPELPHGHTWTDATRAWWDSWRRCPQSETFTRTDWDFLADTALLHDTLWLGDTSVAAELRLRVSKFGATPEDRLRLHMSVEDAPVADNTSGTPSKADEMLATLRVV